MDLRQLEYFVRIAEAGSISAAATRVRISQPALSRQMRLLEAELGRKLFERHGRGVRLTEAGAALLDRAGYYLRQIGQIRDELTAAADEPAGELAVAVFPSLRDMLTVETVVEFRSLYPGVVLRLFEETTRTIREGILDGRYEIGLLSGHEISQAVTFEPLASEAIVLAGPPDSGLDWTRGVTPGELAGYPLIVSAIPPNYLAGIHRMMAGAGLRTNVAIEVNSLVVTDLIARGQGFGVLPYCAVDAPLRRGLVSATPIRNLRVSWVIASLRERRLSVAARRFRDLMQMRRQRKVAAGEWPTAGDCEID
ncbi:MAG: LysR family transcriptional regulator [Alphaproteobacteria bacterium]